MFSGQPHTDTVWDIPYSFGLDSFVEPGVSVSIWSSHLLCGRFLDFFECPRGALLETHPMDAPVNVDSVFSGHYLVDGGPALLLLATLLCLSRPEGPGLEKMVWGTGPAKVKRGSRLGRTESDLWLERPL